MTCWNALTFLGPECCVGCALPLALGESDRCAACLANPPDYDRALAAVAYGPVSRHLVMRLKHGRRPALARVAAGFMLARLRDAAPGLLVPVPLHRGRLWHRGFNQSWEIAKILARALNWPADAHILRRVRATPRLGPFSAEDRKRIVNTAFAVNPIAVRKALTRARDGECPISRIWLVDDVMTSGATASACARVLKSAGVGEVGVILWARVGPWEDPT